MVARSDFAGKKNKSNSVNGSFVPCAKCGSGQIEFDSRKINDDESEVEVKCLHCQNRISFWTSDENVSAAVGRQWEDRQNLIKNELFLKGEYNTSEIVDCIPNKEQIGKFLKELFPDGHEDFIPMCVNAIELHSKKNKAYAHGGNKLGNFERRADFYSHYPGLDLSKPEVVAIVDAMKQLDAALWMLANKYEDEKENIDARLGDCFVYLGIARILHKEGKK